MPWYLQIQQNRTIFLQVYVTHFEYLLLQKFSLLTARQNKSRPGGEIFRIWTRGNNIFFPVKREKNWKTIFIWTAPWLGRETFSSYELKSFVGENKHYGGISLDFHYLAMPYQMLWNLKEYVTTSHKVKAESVVK